MVYFITSSPFTEDGLRLINNDFIDNLRRFWNKSCNVLYIASYPDDYEITDQYAGRHMNIFAESGFEIKSGIVLDRRNFGDAEKLVDNADVIILSGGHCFTEHTFFEELKLKELLKDFDGIIIGISAGSMNSAKHVYAPEEYEEELDNPDFVRYYEGLGLTEKNIYPHYNECRNAKLGDKRLIEDILLKDSFGKEFYVFPDGTYIFGRDGKETLHNFYKIARDGKLFPGNYNIRKIEARDNKAVENLIRSCLIEHGENHEGTAWADPYLGRFSEVYSKEKSEYWVAENPEGRIIAGVGIGPVPGADGVCELQKMYTYPEARGTGIASELVSVALDFAKEFYSRCYLETCESMIRAQKFYIKHGFEYTEENVGNTGHFNCGVKMIKNL